MTTSNSIINTIIVGALVLGTAAPASADFAFPPARLSPDVVFDAGTASEQTIGNPWYHQNESEQRASLKGNETQEISPYPSIYYFVNIRDHGNDESASLAEYRNTRRGDANTADQARIADDRS